MIKGLQADMILVDELEQPHVERQRIKQERKHDRKERDLDRREKRQAKHKQRY